MNETISRRKRIIGFIALFIVTVLFIAAVYYQNKYLARKNALPAGPSATPPAAMVPYQNPLPNIFRGYVVQIDFAKNSIQAQNKTPDQKTIDSYPPHLRKNLNTQTFPYAIELAADPVVHEWTLKKREIVNDLLTGYVKKRTYNPKDASAFPIIYAAERTIMLSDLKKDDEIMVFSNNAIPEKGGVIAGDVVRIIQPQ